MRQELTDYKTPTNFTLWDSLLPEYFMQKKQHAKVKVLDKRHHDEEEQCVYSGIPVWHKDETWTVIVQVESDTLEVKVSKDFYEETSIGDNVEVDFKLSRFYNKNHHIMCSVQEH